MGSFLAELFDAFVNLISNPSSFKGWHGEKQVSKRLKTLDQSSYIHLDDLYIPMKNGQTSQVDHILISSKGIFVIETKNFEGWIMGSENSPTWTRINFKHKNNFPNPVWQNYGHIKAIQEHLGDAAADIPFYSVVVFCKKANLKFKEPFKNADVVSIWNLLRLIETKSGENTLTNFRKEKIKLMLVKLQLKDWRARKEQSRQHVRHIKGNLAEKKLQIANNICPRCGGGLVTRSGKNGSFKGCANYPKCRFIA
ncbi:NERD domain-containing protein [Neobacillus notoginsengisoli]|uniref:NERD domain-containing protein n=1 Tax=Neobacillus notoginsengisoli TaxID=1578198 RepID=UPI001314E9DA|nr:NERD domain-containing protein [Neobacillus notoginsengisoli]